MCKVEATGGVLHTNFVGAFVGSAATGDPLVFSRFPSLSTCHSLHVLCQRMRSQEGTTLSKADLQLLRDQLQLLHRETMSIESSRIRSLRSSRSRRFNGSSGSIGRLEKESSRRDENESREDELGEKISSATANPQVVLLHSLFSYAGTQLP
jgi:hypothetical protein